MEFLRYVVLLIIVGGSTSVGFLISKKYSDRVKELTSFANLINILQNKIKFTHKPLPEALEEISKIKENSKITQIFLKVSEKMKSQKTEEAWTKVLQEERIFLNLTDEDINMILTLGNVLGKTNIEGQMSELNQFSCLIKNQIKKAYEEQNKNEKMCKSLGTIIGLAIAVVFF